MIKAFSVAHQSTRQKSKQNEENENLFTCTRSRVRRRKASGVYDLLCLHVFPLEYMCTPDPLSKHKFHSLFEAISSLARVNRERLASVLHNT